MKNNNYTFEETFNQLLNLKLMLYNIYLYHYLEQRLPNYGSWDKSALPMYWIQPTALIIVMVAMILEQKNHNNLVLFTY